MVCYYKLLKHNLKTRTSTLLYLLQQPGGCEPGFFLREFPNWPTDTKVPDDLLLCLQANSTSFMVVLVELKGSDKEYAIKQLDDTAEILCSRSKFPQQPHSRTVLQVLMTTHPQGHSTKILGVMIGRRSLPQKLRKKKIARVHTGLKIKDLTTTSLVTTVAELRTWFD